MTVLTRFEGGHSIEASFGRMWPWPAGLGARCHAPGQARPGGPSRTPQQTAHAFTEWAEVGLGSWLPSPERHRKRPVFCTTEILLAYRRGAGGSCPVTPTRPSVQAGCVRRGPESSPPRVDLFGGHEPTQQQALQPQAQERRRQAKVRQCGQIQSHLPPRPSPVKLTWHLVQAIVPCVHSLPMTFSLD